jgi:predicted nucleic acid-binding protein
MIALDTSSIIAFLGGDPGPDAELVESAFVSRQGVLPPVVVTELLSARAASVQIAPLISQIPRLEIMEGYWERAGRLRASILRRGLKAAIADTLIVQSCLDHDVALVTRDRDFRNFARHAGLRLQ